MDTRPMITRFTERDWETDETDGSIRFALVGLGWWTMDVVVPAIEQSDYCETTVLVSSSTEKAERLADENNVESGITYDEFHDGAAVEKYDAVYIGTPNAYHLDYVETAADLEKAVLCEKPLEATVERAEQLVEAADEADIPLMTAYPVATRSVPARRSNCRRSRGDSVTRDRDASRTDRRLRLRARSVRRRGHSQPRRCGRFGRCAGRPRRPRATPRGAQRDDDRGHRTWGRHSQAKHTNASAINLTPWRRQTDRLEPRLRNS